MTKVQVGLSEMDNGFHCGVDVARAALGKWTPESVSMAILFASHPEPEKVLAGVNSILPNTLLIGATSAGQYAHEGYVESGAGLMVIHSDQLEFHPIARRWRWPNTKRLLSKLHGISNEGFGRFNYRSLVIFPDNHSMNLDRVVQKAVSETGMMYDILGGAGLTPPETEQPPAIFFNNRIIRAGFAGAELLSQQALGLALTNGWSPASGPYRVTHADEHRVIKLDGRPAREVFEDFFTEQGLALDDLAELLRLFPIGIVTNSTIKVSASMAGFDPYGALLVTTPPPVGSLVHILTTQPDAMLGAAQRAIQQAQQQITAPAIAGALFIDCMSTRMVLGEAYHQQKSAVQNQLGNTPFLGFRSHGVLARLQGQTSGHYECSVAACLLPE